MQTVFLQGVPEFDTLLEVKHDSLDRFASIIIPIAGIFELHTKSLHIFYDVPGGPIAFNRRGAVYLNLRFFEEWRECNLFCGYGSKSTWHISRQMTKMLRNAIESGLTLSGWCHFLPLMSDLVDKLCIKVSCYRP